MGFFKSKPTADIGAIISACSDLDQVKAARAIGSRIAALSDNIRRLDDAIALAEGDLTALAAPELPRATAERARLAAAVRLGESDAAELERFDSEQAKALRAAEAALARISADREALQNTLAVLQARRTAADGELATLRQQAADAVAAALRAVGQAVAAGYLEAIGKAAPMVAALRYLSDRAYRHGGNAFALAGLAAGATWPSFDFGDDSVANELTRLASVAEPFNDSLDHEKMRAELTTSLAGLGLTGI